MESIKKVPKRRFKGFTAVWEQRKLGDFTSLITKGTTPKDKSNNGDITFVKVENLSNGQISSNSKINVEEHEGYLKRSQLKEGDILFSIAGTLGRTASVDKTILPANTNQALAIIRGYQFDKNFLLTSLSGKVVNDYIRKNPTIGAQPNLSLEQVKNLTIWTPNEKEQTKIGNFFKQLDDTIALHQRKLNKLKNMKQAYLQEMFPADGETKPKRRFEGFTDGWEQHKFKEFTKISQGLQIAISERFTEPKENRLFYITNEFLNPNSSVTYYIQDAPKSVIANKKDILMTRTGNTGKVVTGVYGAFHNNFFKISYDENKVNHLYLFYLLNSNYVQNEIRIGAGSSTIPDLKHPNFYRIEVKIPEFSEQTKIGNFFKQLDDTIAFQEQKLTKLQQLKSAYLEEMFV